MKVAEESVIKPPDVVISEADASLGRGVFAARSFAEGETIEAAPLVVLPQGQHGLPEQLKHRTFAWGKLCSTNDSSEAIVWGYGSLYNHGNPSNMSYEPDISASVMRFVAARDIAEGEELTVNYNGSGGGHVSDTDDWFDRQNVKPV